MISKMWDNFFCFSSIAFISLPTFSFFVKSTKIKSIRFNPSPEYPVWNKSSTASILMLWLHFFSGRSHHHWFELARIWLRLRGACHENWVWGQSARGGGVTPSAPTPSLPDPHGDPWLWPHRATRAGIFKQSTGARNRVGIGYRTGPPGYVGWRYSFPGIDSWAS